MRNPWGKGLRIFYIEKGGLLVSPGRIVLYITRGSNKKIMFKAILERR